MTHGTNCETDSPYGGRFVSDFEYLASELTLSFDLGDRPFNRRQIAAFTVGYITPRFDRPVLRAVAFGLARVRDPPMRNRATG